MPTLLRVFLSPVVSIVGILIVWGVAQALGVAGAAVAFVIAVAAAMSVLSVLFAFLVQLPLSIIDALEVEEDLR